MKSMLPALLLTSAAVASGWDGSAREPQAAEPASQENSCIQCHGEKELWDDEQLRLFVTPDDFADDVHWQSGLRCHDCHGGDPTTTDVTKAHAVATELDSMASACDRCHVEIAGLLAQTRMKHQFEQIGLPGCVTCHGHHDIRSPSDEMLGMGVKAVCVHCHTDGQFGAPFAGARMASAMRASLEQLKARLAEADAKLSRAEQLAIDVEGPRYDLHQASTALANARTLVHSFSFDPMSQALDEGLQMADRAVQGADDALHRHRVRKIWLGTSVVAVLVAGLLVWRYVRTLPSPTV